MMEVMVTAGAVRPAKLQPDCCHQETNIQFLLLQTGCPSSRSTNRVETLKGKATLKLVSAELKSDTVGWATGRASGL